jgi:hypothetical protein
MDKCELMDTCSFYWNFRDHPASIERQLTNRYCFSEELPGNCARIQRLLVQEESPSPDISPEGDSISIENKKAVLQSSQSSDILSAGFNK